MELQETHGTGVPTDPNKFQRNEDGEFEYPEDIRQYNRNQYREDPPDSYYAPLGVAMGKTGMFCVPVWTKEQGQPKQFTKSVVDILFLRDGGSGFLSAGVLNAVAHNLKELNSAVPNTETVEAIDHIYKAVALLQKRQEDRKARGVYGTKEA